jgi:hypothetical protein
MQTNFGGGGPTFKTLNTYKADKYNLRTPEVKGPHFQRESGGAPGTKGSYVINYGFRSQGVDFTVLYIDTTEAAVMNTFLSDCDSLVGPNDLTIGAKTIKRCYLDADKTHNSDIEKIQTAEGDGSGGIFYMMVAVIGVTGYGAAQ